LYFRIGVPQDIIGLKRITTMKKVAYLFLFGSVFLAGCPKHEIIPAPTPKVELNAHFIGVVNGSNTELTQGVGGFMLEATKAKIILPSPNLSSAVYNANFKTDQGLISMNISLGSIFWDASLASDPSLTQFNDFFDLTSTLEPDYKTAAAQGFEVVYRDGFGNIWKSNENDPGAVVFSDILQESDATGDYTKFKCSFDCILYRTVGQNTYTLAIEDAEYTGWFKR
jgi:hypothetical protein